MQAVTRYEKRLVLYATRITGDGDRSRDVVQETFLRLCRQRPDKIGDGLGPWLFRVCRNLAIDVKRKESRMKTLDETQTHRHLAPDPAPVEIVSRNESAREIVVQLATLPDSQQEALRLKFQHGLTYREIGKIMKLTTSSVGVLIHNGLVKLRSCLAKSQSA